MEHGSQEADSELLLANEESDIVNCSWDGKFLVHGEDISNLKDLHQIIQKEQVHFLRIIIHLVKWLGTGQYYNNFQR